MVEDDRRLAATLRRGLEAEGFAVDHAVDGEEGVWLASEQPYDAILLDIMLPKLNGFQVCAALRARGVWTPILMLTAKDGEHDEAEALDTGADDYLTKPFSYVVLVAHIRAIRRRGAVERPAAVVIGDLVLEPSSRRCRRGDVTIELTAKEFAILEHLARRAGAVVSKAELLDHAWDFAYGGDPAVIEVHISNIRGKIDDLSAPRRSRPCAAPATGSRQMAVDPLRRATLRLRITAFATVTVAAALIAGAVFLVTLLRSRLDATASDAAALRARDVAALSTSGSLPDTLALLGEETAFVQVVDDTGDVIASSDNVRGRAPVSGLRPAIGHTVTFTLSASLLGERDRYRVVAISVDTPTSAATVFAGESLEHATETTTTITDGVTLGVVVIVVLVGSVSWWAVGRTLRPVRAITTTISDITASDLHRRVPSPSGNDEIAQLARDGERDPGTAGRVHRTPTAVRRRREPRAAQPARLAPGRPRDLARAPCEHRLAGGRQGQPQRRRTAAAAHRRPPRACPHGCRTRCNGRPST